MIPEPPPIYAYYLQLTIEGLKNGIEPACDLDVTITLLAPRLPVKGETIQLFCPAPHKFEIINVVFPADRSKPTGYQLTIRYESPLQREWLRRALNESFHDGNTNGMLDEAG